MKIITLGNYPETSLTRAGLQMNHEDFVKKEAALLRLAARASDGDTDAVDKLYEIAQAALVQHYEQQRDRERTTRNRERTTNKRKKYQIILWAVSAAKKQIADHGHFNLKELTADTIALAELGHAHFTEHTVRKVIKDNIETIVNYAKSDANTATFG